MRILFVCERAPYLPCADDDRVASAELLAALAARHDVAVVGVAAVGDGELQRRWSSRHAVTAEILPAATWRHGLTGAPGLAIRALGDAFDRHVARFAPDVAYLDGAMLAPLAVRTRVPTVLAPHAARRSVTSRPALTRLGGWLGVDADDRWQRRWFAAATACVVASAEERAALARWLPSEHIDVVPAGVDLKRYEFRRVPLAEPRMVFAGDLASRSHVMAARRFVRSVLPRIRQVHATAELLLVGTAPSAAGRALSRVPGVRVMAPVADVRPSVWSAAVCVSPLDGGANLVLPAMALGTPVVASPASLGGVPDVVDRRHLLVAGTEADVTSAVLAMLDDASHAKTIARSARDLVEQRYSWPAIATRHEAVLARVAGRREAPALRRAA